MFFVVCPFCHIGIEIPAASTAPDCAAFNNVGNCPECDEAFFFDACEVDHQPESETAA